MATTDSTLLQIPLEGVESEHCARIVDNGLRSLEGVTTHSIELNNNRVLINETKAFNLLPSAVKAIRDLGYGDGGKSVPALAIAYRPVWSFPVCG